MDTQLPVASRLSDRDIIPPRTQDPLVVLIRQALLSAARYSHDTVPVATRIVHRAGYIHVFGDAEVIATVAVEALRKDLAQRLSGFAHDPSQHREA